MKMKFREMEILPMGVAFADREIYHLFRYLGKIYAAEGWPGNMVNKKDMGLEEDEHPYFLYRVISSLQRQSERYYLVPELRKIGWAVLRPAIIEG